MKRTVESKCIADHCGRPYTLRHSETSRVPFARMYCPKCLAAREAKYKDVPVIAEEPLKRTLDRYWKAFTWPEAN